MTVRETKEMYKVENIRGIGSAPRPQEIQGSASNLNSVSDKKELSTQKSGFAQKFEKIKSDEVRTKLEGIFEKISQKSEMLKDTLSLKGVVEYKKLVREFMKVATENSNVFSRNSFLDRRGRHRVHSMIKQVDRELNAITQEFTKSPLEHGKVLNSIDAIKGLIIDIMM